MVLTINGVDKLGLKSKVSPLSVRPLNCGRAETFEAHI